jgi:hypothetical protein
MKYEFNTNNQLDLLIISKIIYFTNIFQLNHFQISAKNITNNYKYINYL